MKKRIVSIASGILLCSAWGLPGAATAADKIVLTVGFESGIDSAQGVGVQAMAKLLEEKSNGQIELKAFPDSQLGTGPEMIQMVRDGKLDIFQGGAGYFGAFDGRLNVFDIPYLFNSVEDAYKVLDSAFGREMLETLEPHGMKGLAFWENGIRSVTNKVRPIHAPKDLEGLRMRVMLGNPVHVELWKLFGTTPFPLPGGKIYEETQKDNIDGQEHPVAAVYDSKWYEVHKYMSFTRHMYGPLIQVMNLPKFNALSPEMQKVVLDASYGGAVTQRQYANSNEELFIEKMKAAGLIVNEVDSGPFRAKVRPPIEKEFIRKNGDAWLKKIDVILK